MTVGMSLRTVARIFSSRKCASFHNHRIYIMGFAHQTQYIVIVIVKLPVSRLRSLRFVASIRALINCGRYCSPLSVPFWLAVRSKEVWFICLDSVCLDIASSLSISVPKEVVGTFLDLVHQYETLLYPDEQSCAVS